MPGGDVASAVPARPVPLFGLTTVSSTLVGASCLVSLLDAWTSWYRHGVAAGYAVGAPGVGVADLTSASSTSRTVDTLYMFAMISTSVALLVWLSRVRANARARGRATRRLPRTLAVGVWLALALFSMTMTVLPGADATVDELAMLARVDSYGAVGMCVAGVVLLVVIRQTTRWVSTETNRPGQAMRG